MSDPEFPAIPDSSYDALSDYTLQLTPRMYDDLQSMANVNDMSVDTLVRIELDLAVRKFHRINRKPIGE